jgi:ATP-dependent Clp protease ATP-binding subunit ClpA
MTAEATATMPATHPTLLRRFLYDAVATQSGLPGEFLESEKHASLIDQALARIRERIFGQDLAIEKLGSTLKAKTAERFVGWDEAVRTLRPTWDRRPIACFLAVGPTGVGKTETAKLLANAFFGGRLIALNGSEVGPEAAHGTSMWTGSPPGYVGSDRGGVLTNGLRLHHSGVILIDELEKADREAVQNIILPLMGEGIVTDKNNGETLCATDFIIFCTSNIAIRPEMLQAMGFQTVEDSEITERAIFDAVAEHILPEVIGRFNAILRYQPLTLDAQWKVWSSLRHELACKIGPDTRIVLDDAAKRFIQEQFAQIQTGARGIRDLFLDQVVPLSVGAKAGDTISIAFHSNQLAKVELAAKAP